MTPGGGKGQCVSFLTKLSSESDSEALGDARGRGFSFLVWLGFVFFLITVPFPSPHRISVRLFCRTRSLPELVWRLGEANEHLGHGCIPNQASTALHWPTLDQLASPHAHHLCLLHKDSFLDVTPDGSEG